MKRISPNSCLLSAAVAALSLLTWSANLQACGLHAGFRGFGMWGGNAAAARQLQQIPEPVFTLSYQPPPPMVVGQEAELLLRHQNLKPVDKPRLLLEGSENVEFISGSHIDLQQATGQTPIRFRLTDPGYSYINATISGQRQGAGGTETSHNSIYIYVRVKSADG